jgi:LacI family transcriptional regulator/LacI family repressor for deo operon, udp, cdd, tsx, nupC, and nupG
MSTLKEVAKKANVSITTVSRVINDPEKVNTETRERVREAMEALNFQPNRVAQRLRGNKGRSRLLGLIIPDIQNQFYSSIVRGIEDMSYGKDYAIILCNTDENPEKEKFYLDVLKSESVDGIILPPIRQNGNLIRELLEAKIPVICFDRKLSSESIDTVIVDNEMGGYMAASHLLEAGHKKIAVITSSLQFTSFEDRLRGYENALVDSGIEINEKLIKKGDHRKSETGKMLTLQLLDQNPKPTAIFVLNNQMALGAIEAINERKLKIPDDISIVGFDDIQWARVISPSITVIRQPAYEMGRRIAELFFQKVKDPEREPVQIILQPKLIVRQSTAPVQVAGTVD